MIDNSKVLKIEDDFKNKKIKKNDLVKHLYYSIPNITWNFAQSLANKIIEKNVNE